MGRDRQWTLGLAVAYVALVIASLFAMDWFVFSSGGLLALGGGVDNVGIDLRGIHACVAGECARVSYASIGHRGIFPTLATLTFWVTILWSLLVLYQGGIRFLSGGASESLTRLGYLAGMLLFVLVVATGYLFGPQIGGARAEALGVEIVRTWAPLLLLGAVVAGMSLLYVAANEGGVDVEYTPLTQLVPAARALPAKAAPAPELAVAPVASSSEHPGHVRGLRFAVHTAELSRVGVEARREDGSMPLVMWTDVVGVVARRMPAEHDGVTFVDLVSRAGATLRFLPWTRLGGEPVEGRGDDLARALLALVARRCPSVKIDPATRDFLDGDRPPHQLPSLEILGAHDEKLA